MLGAAFGRNQMVSAASPHLIVAHVLGMITPQAEGNEVSHAVVS
jgi:hypothetical protein